MAAGLGFKDFVTGEVLTAADVDGYLMQGVWVFASAAARDAAVTSPQEGNFAYLKDTNVTTYYTGSAWANLDTTGMTNPMTTTGDTIYSSSGSTPARLGIGSTGQVLTVAGGVPTWATASSGGMTLLQTLTLSGSSTTSSTFSSSYKQIVCYMKAVGVSGSAGWRVKPNGIGTIGAGEYNTQTIAMQDATNVSGSSLNYAYGMILGAATDSTDANKRFSGILTIMKPSDTGTVFIQSNGMSYEGSGTKMFALNSMAILANGAAITTLEFKPDSGTYTYGTVEIYGVN